MQYVVITFGTEGDTRPLVGVCRALMDAGHGVKLLADRSTLDTAKALGVSTLALAGDMKATVAPGGALSRLMMEGGDASLMAKAVAKIANEHTTQWLQAVLTEARAMKADAVLFSGIASYVGLAAADYLGVPAIGLGLWPISPTRDFPSPLLPPMRMPGWLNRLSHQGVNAVSWRMFRKTIQSAQRAVNSPQTPRQKAWTNYPILYGVSQHLIPRPADWSELWQICGAWSAPSAKPWRPAPALANFLKDGPAPIYIGFGSMAGFDQRTLLTTLIEAVDGRRVVFFPGWSGITAIDLPRNFCLIGATPHEQLFPLMSMVMHHGGAGTTHTAARAGVPSVVIPFAGDQFFWADRLARAGVAPPAVPHTRIHPARLKAMIAWAQRDEVRSRAQALGQAMAEEHGVQVAVELIEKYSRRGRT
ncbi:glycosyl transferase, UDP-glucuronosyltransferase [Leptothrix ochracea L12]|uniref:Glycosyl transferase, UDP-glucuronosyltransferase n=1 Tax=Leptothrix ochracea L12 TaxID=735332 RepID=I4Z507_9BURK|nr:glycosyltransferase [Leptothrix ochracea]EIM31299.1 glycosyl transferase, UDP-glucuronosyltransferase [Leptothrix ochracea L12]